MLAYSELIAEKKSEQRLGQKLVVMKRKHYRLSRYHFTPMISSEKLIAVEVLQQGARRSHSSFFRAITYYQPCSINNPTYAGGVYSFICRAVKPFMPNQCEKKLKMENGFYLDTPTSHRVIIIWSFVVMVLITRSI